VETAARPKLLAQRQGRKGTENVMKIAVVGAGISGLGTAWMLARRHEVSLFEAADYLGGHSNTVDMVLDGRRVPVDTGFIVYNEHNYPNLTRLFAALGVSSSTTSTTIPI
jgi:predicted NAD/FAD-binding protein